MQKNDGYVVSSRMFDISDQNKSMLVVQIRNNQLKQIQTSMIHPLMREHDQPKDVHQQKLDMQLNIQRNKFD
jgi:hypothetical protein